MKSKELKRQEAIDRAVLSYEFKRVEKLKGLSLEEYLDQFKSKKDPYSFLAKEITE